jgi:protein-disulfide isomerase
MSKRAEIRRRREQKARQQRLMLIGGVALAAVLIAAWLIYPTLQPVGEIVAITPQAYPNADGSALGPTGAPVTVLVYSDFQCPNCRNFSNTVERQIIETYGGTGQVRLDYAHFIVIDGNVGGSESRQSAEASECAAEQGQFWNYHEILFANWAGEGVGAFSNRRLQAYAESIGLDMAAFNACFSSNRTAGVVTGDEAAARALGVNGTPTVFINGQVVPQTNVFDFEYYQQAIEAQVP